MRKLLIMLSIASGIVTTATFTMESDKQSQEKPPATALTYIEEFFGFNLSDVRRELGSSNIDFNNIQLDFDFCMVLDSPSIKIDFVRCSACPSPLTELEKQQIDEYEKMMRAKQLAANKAAAEKEEKK